MKINAYTTDPVIPPPPPSTSTNQSSVVLTPNILGLDLLQTDFFVVGVGIVGAIGSSPSTAVTGIPAGATGGFNSFPQPGSALYNITPGLTTPPGTYTVTVTYTDSLQTCVAYLTLVIYPTTYANPLPRPASGAYDAYATPPALTMYLLDSCQFAAFVLGNSGYAIADQYTITGLPDFTFLFLQQGPDANGKFITLFSTPDTPPGTYTLSLNASDYSGVTPFLLTLTILGTAPPPTPYSKIAGAGRYFGLIKKGQQGRTILRRMAIPVNPNAPAQSRWRHVFSTQKGLFRSMGAFGANSTPIAGIQPLSAWTAQALSFSSYGQPGGTGGINPDQGYNGPLSTTEAYIVMVQTTMASLGQAPLPTPAVTEISGQIVPVSPSPTFDLLKTLTAGTVYDQFYNVVGIFTLPNMLGNPPSPAGNGATVISVIAKVVASGQYSNFYSPPAASTWKPISFTTSPDYSPAGILAAWEQVWGPLPPSGSLKLQWAWVDPVTGCVGNSASTTVSWQQGTLKGFYRPAWLGPIFVASGPNSPISQAHGTTQTYAISALGAPSQPGWDGGAGVPYGGTITWTAYPVTGQLIAGLSEATLVFSTITIPLGNTTVQYGTLTVTIPAADYYPSFFYTLSAGDGISTDSASLQIIAT